MANILQAVLFLSLVLISQLMLIQSAEIVKKETKDNATLTSDFMDKSQNVTIGGEPSKSNTGTIVAVCIICVIIGLTIIIAVFFIRRKRKLRLMDKEKKMQIQMSSARNAGVYQDLTVSVPTDEKPPASPEHERLKAAEDV